MRKPHHPRDWSPRAFAIARLFRVPPALIGLVPFRDGRPRSPHRRRRAGRAA